MSSYILGSHSLYQLYSELWIVNIILMQMIGTVAYSNMLCKSEYIVRTLVLFNFNLKKLTQLYVTDSLLKLGTAIVYNQD